MLPERLSTNLTSLVQDQDRLCVVIEMNIEANGTLGQSAIYRALVRNRAKLAYRSVAAWLQGKAAAPSRVGAVAGLDAQLRLQDTIAQALKGQRQAKGALEFDTAENRAVYEGAVLIDLQPDPKNRAQELKAELRSTVGEAVALIRALPPERLSETIRPQGYEGTVLAAIYHVVEHFAGHAFQIMFATKLLTGGDLGFYAHLSRAQTHQEKLP